MRLRAALALMAALGLGTVPAWGLSGQTVSLGIHGGLNFHNIETPAEIASSTRSGFTVGANTEVPLARIFSLQPELNFSQRGGRLAAGPLRADVTLNSLEIPVYFKWHTGTTVRPFLMAGPQAVFNLSQTVEGGGVGLTFDSRTLEWGAAFAAGLELANFAASLRYRLGLTDVSSTSASWRSRGWQLLIGLRFG